MRLVYFGTSEYASAILEVLAASRHQVLLAVTQPDKPKGRGHHVEHTPVKKTAMERGIDIIQPLTVNDEDTRERLREADADLFVVVSFGSLLKRELLEVSPLPPINVHPSLLPKYRGAAPMERALMAGEKESGVTIMEMTEALDAGPILLQQTIPIQDSWNQGDLNKVLAEAGGQLLLQALDGLEAGSLKGKLQDEAAHTYARKIRREEKYLDFSLHAVDLSNQIRGLVPRSVPMVLFRERLLGLLEGMPDKRYDPAKEPGSILEIDREKGILVNCKDSSLWISRVKPEGKKEMAARDFINGSRLQLGELLKSRT